MNTDQFINIDKKEILIEDEQNLLEAYKKSKD